MFLNENYLKYYKALKIFYKNIEKLSKFFKI